MWQDAEGTGSKTRRGHVTGRWDDPKPNISSQETQTENSKPNIRNQRIQTKDDKNPS